MAAERAVTPFVGRDDEAGAVLAAARGGGRLITLTGVGGVGKTRLATEVVSQLSAELQLPTVAVALRPITAAEAVWEAIADAAGWVLADAADADGTVLAQLARRPALLVLDNVEQIPDVGRVVARLVAECPQVTILVTSRRSVGLAVETIVPVRPLAPSAAAELAVAAVRAHDPAYELPAANAAALREFCVRLDGLPLAIELAAARLRLFSPGDLIGLLDDRFSVLSEPSDDGGPGGLWAAIEWSYRLLSADDQRRFRALGVFPDSFDLSGAAAVIGEPATLALDAVTTLVDHHLVAVAGHRESSARFALLESLRDFAVGQLETHGELGQATSRMVDWCVELTERCGPMLTTSETPRASGALMQELPLMRRTISIAAAAERPEATLRVLAATSRWWHNTGRPIEALEALTAAIDASQPPGVDTAILAGALSAASDLQNMVGDQFAACEFAERAIQLFDAVGDEGGRAEAMNHLAVALCDMGDLDRSADLHQRAYDVFGTLRSPRARASALTGLATVAERRGEFRQAVGLWERADELLVETGDRASRSIVAANLALGLLRLGDLERSIAAFDRAIEQQEVAGQTTYLGAHLALRSIALTELGRLDDAEADLARASRIVEGTRLLSVGNVVALGRAWLLRAQGKVGAASRQLAVMTARTVADGFYLYALDGVEVLAQIALQMGEAETADRILKVTRGARRATGTVPVDLNDPRLAPLERGLAGWEDELRALVPVVDEFALEHGNAVVDGATDPLVALGLSPREAEVARMLVVRKTDAEIAAALFVSVHTVVSHVGSVRRKLDVRSRREVATRLAELDIHVPSA